VIGVDASVLVRYLVQHPAEAASRAATVIEGDDDVGISVVVLLETAHVLRTQYGVRRQATVEALIDLATRENVVVLGLSRSEALEALARARSLPGTPIADAFVASMARAGGALPLFTFDRGLGRHGIEVVTP